MIVIRNEVDGWEFRGRKNGQVECRNEKAGLDWALRGASDIGYFDDHLGIIWDALNGLTACLPNKEFSLPEVRHATELIEDAQNPVESEHL